MPNHCIKTKDMLYVHFIRTSNSVSKSGQTLQTWMQSWYPPLDHWECQTPPIPLKSFSDIRLTSVGGFIDDSSRMVLTHIFHEDGGTLDPCYVIRKPLCVLMLAIIGHYVSFALIKMAAALSKTEWRFLPTLFLTGRYFLHHKQPIVDFHHKNWQFVCGVVSIL